MHSKINIKIRKVKKSKSIQKKKVHYTGERKGGKNREKEIGRARETDKDWQRGGETEWETERDRETDREGERHTERQTETQR